MENIISDLDLKTILFHNETVKNLENQLNIIDLQQENLNLKRKLFIIELDKKKEIFIIYENSIKEKYKLSDSDTIDSLTGEIKRIA